MKNIPYGRQEITAEDLEAVNRVLQSDFLTQGPEISKFENAFAQYVNAPYAIAISNGTAALHLAAMALGVKPGDKAITTPITFAASANCVRYCGGDVTFCDVEAETGLLDPNRVEDELKKHPAGTYKGIIPVDYAGHPADLPAFRTLADKYNLWILQDACHSPGGSLEHNGETRLCGDAVLADVVAFSFHPVKHIATAEGGMLTTRKAEIAEQLLVLRTHGITRDPNRMKENHGGWYYEMVELGYNYRLTDMQAALGTSQLSRANVNLEKRRSIARKYDDAFRGTNIKTPFIKNGFHHAFHLYVISTENRLELYNHLRSRNIFAQVHYIPVHLMPYYQQFGWKKGMLPVAEKFYETCLSIPMYPSLTQEEQDYVIAAILEFTR